MGRENVIITGNLTAANNQSTGFGNTFLPPTSNTIIYGRVISVNTTDRSITYELLNNPSNVSAIDKKTKPTGTAYNFNPNFTRLPEIKEIVPIIKGPSKRGGLPAGSGDNIDYYILGPISVQNTPDDNQLPKTAPTVITTPTALSYKYNEIGIVDPRPLPVSPVEPSPVTSTPTPTPTSTPTPTPTPDPKGIFQETYTNKANQQFNLYSKKSGFNTTIYAYKKENDILVRTGPSSSTSELSTLLNEMRLALQDNVYP